MTKTATPKQTKITVSKLSHRLSRNGWISYNCELRKGRTTLAAVDQEGVGGVERVGTIAQSRSCGDDQKVCQGVS